MNFKTSLTFLTEHGNTLNEFRKTTRKEVLNLLQQLQRFNEPITVFANENEELLICLLLEINEKDNVLYLENTHPEIQINPSSKAICVAALGGGALIQFVVEELNHAYKNTRPILQSPIPDSLIKLQRREHFRSKAPIINPYLCTLQLGGKQILRMPIYDLSMGGLSCWLPADQRALIQLSEPYISTLELGSYCINNAQIKVCGLLPAEQGRQHAEDLLLSGLFVNKDHQFDVKLQAATRQLELAQRSLQP
ncbi:flagellar brake protein [Iodobacter sp.]|uniref:flagellar brake protein n=1 Tax=Iodobacter sp. TaxID=1915058 RepID=UPI0025CE6B78|nr:flagellar brake protein [Iodobacter sp.]